MAANSEEALLLKQIEKAWNSRPLPDPVKDVGSSGSTDEFGVMHGIYAGRKWNDVLGRDVSGGYASITLMRTDVARSYYTGTYLLETLKVDRFDQGDLMDAVEVVLSSIIQRGSLEKVYSRDQLLCLQKFFRQTSDLSCSAYDHVQKEIDRVLTRKP